jgi:hypothetical protein
MSYGYVYVAQVAMGADKGQTLKAMAEAEAYHGPSHNNRLFTLRAALHEGRHAGLPEGDGQGGESAATGICSASTLTGSTKNSSSTAGNPPRIIRNS